MALFIKAVLDETQLRSLGILVGGTLPANFAELIVGTLNRNPFARISAVVRLVSALKKNRKRPRK
jgi:hypothetical protein